jgi:hypothetical protein
MVVMNGPLYICAYICAFNPLGAEPMGRLNLNSPWRALRVQVGMS